MVGRSIDFSNSSGMLLHMSKHTDSAERNSPVTIEELTEEMNRFVEAMGWYEVDSPAPQTPRNIAISLSLEAAEVLEHFQWDGEVGDREELAGELADVALYLLQLAYLVDIDLGDAIWRKLDMNYRREWSERE